MALGVDALRSAFCPPGDSANVERLPIFSAASYASHAASRQPFEVPSDGEFNFTLPTTKITKPENDTMDDGTA